MVLLQMILTRIFERLPPCYAKITLMLIADPLQSRSRGIKDGIIMDHNIDINDRLCR